MKTQTKTKVEAPSHWPPIIHITTEDPVRPGSRALCGAKLMGILFPESTITCKKCVEIDKIRQS